ncbi:hypothetical protein PC116_g26927 [Phytophthora cactorum]|nr:hypothetical protein PC116_g26927 [Phytophthora cactorum]
MVGGVSYLKLDAICRVSRRAFASACDFIVAYFNQASDAHSQGKAMHSSWALSHGAENEILVSRNAENTLLHDDLTPAGSIHGYKPTY